MSIVPARAADFSFAFFKPLPFGFGGGADDSTASVDISPGIFAVAIGAQRALYGYKWYFKSCAHGIDD